MERRLWTKVYHLLKAVEARRDRRRRSRGVVYSDLMIAAVYFWQVICDQTQDWACQLVNWPRGRASLPAGWPGLPSRSQYGRRLRSRNVKHLIDQLEQTLRDRHASGRSGGLLADLLLCVDGKPLPVSSYSKDPDIGAGYGAGGRYFGYKLHAVWGDGPMPRAWCLCAANVSEPRVAEHLVGLLGHQAGPGYLLGDAAYDTHRLYAAAAAAGRQLVAPRKRPHTGLGHRRHHADRLAAIASIESRTEPSMRLLFGPANAWGMAAVPEHPLAEHLHNQRGLIERQFGRLTQGVGGLRPLPAHVRRQSRVRRWVQAKLILNALSA